MFLITKRAVKERDAWIGVWVGTTKADAQDALAAGDAPIALFLYADSANGWANANYRDRYVTHPVATR